MATACIARCALRVHWISKPIVARFDQPQASSDGAPFAEGGRRAARPDLAPGQRGCSRSRSGCATFPGCDG